MKRVLALVLFSFVFLQVSRAQSEQCSFLVIAQLVDKDLNLKPIPKLKLSLREVNATHKTPFSTDFEGKLKGILPCGSYRITSDAPLDFEGKSYSWDLPYKLSTGQHNDLELSVDNASTAVLASPSTNGVGGGRATDELVVYFKKYEGSVVTVWSEFGRGTGFFFDDLGLILTNQHVVGRSEYIAVQSDPEHKVPAVLLASDPNKDVAVLWAAKDALPGTVVAPLAKPVLSGPLAVEGERVFTIGSPLNQRKIITTGIVSKVESRAIISDVNINHGNSGGPLFNSLGSVIGITTFLDASAPNGPGISGIVRIEQTEDVIEEARRKMQQVTRPSATLLPTEPRGSFPVEALRVAGASGQFDLRPYVFEEGDYSVAVLTPVMMFQQRERSRLEASKEKAKRVRNARAAPQDTFAPLDDLHNWEEYVGEYQPVIQIRATPKLRVTRGSAVARVLTSRNGVSAIPAKMRFRTDFYRMTLRCGGKEVQPIHPGKIPRVVDVKNGLINATDATYEGLYTFPADAISPNCGQVSLDIYSEKDVLRAKVKELDPKTVNRVWEDFAPFRDQASSSK